MKIFLAGFALLFFLLPQAPAGAETFSPPTPGVTTSQTSQRKVVEMVLPGRLLDTSFPNLPLILLVSNRSPEGDRTRSVLKFDTAGEGHLETLATGLPKSLESIHLLPGSGEEHEILLGESGVIHRLNTLNQTLEPLLQSRHLDLDASKRLSGGTGTALLVPRVGLLERWSQQSKGALFKRHSFELPVRVDRQRGGLRLFTPPLNPVRGATIPQVVLGPVAQGKQRLQSIAINLNANPDSDDEDQESWALLPSPETVEDRWYVSIDDQPALVVTTTNSEKLGIFEKKKLRVFPLRHDRTRSGRRPSLATDTTTRRWYSPGIEVLDWDGDGRDDLAVIAPDGLGAKKLVLQVYAGEGQGSFHPRPRKTVVTAPQARWRFGKDVDGDQRPDLVTSDKNGLRIFTGVLSGQKRGVVEKTPRVTWTLNALASPTLRRTLATHKKETDKEEDQDDLQPSRLRVVDLDSDGKSELFVRSRLMEKTVLWWITLQE